MKTIAIRLAAAITLILSAQLSFAQPWETNGEDIYNTNTGNIGIGTNTLRPETRVTIKTNLSTAGWAHIGGADSIIVDESIGGVSASLGTMTNHAFRLKANGQGMLHLYPDGKLVIGSNVFAPVRAARLTIQTNGGHGLVHSDGAVHVGISIPVLPSPIPLGGYFGTISNHPIGFYTNSGNNGVHMTIQTNGNVGIATTLELGFGAGGKEVNAGKIGYQTFTADALDIVGAGTVVGNRKIKFWNEGGAEFAGTIGIGIVAPTGPGLHVNRDNEAIRLTGSQPFISFYNGANYKGFMLNRGADDIEIGTASENTNGKLNLSIKGTPYLSISNTGSVSVNGSPGSYYSPSFTVNVNGINGGLAIKYNNDIQWNIYPGYGLRFMFNGIEKAMVTNDGDWHTMSDISLKEKILPYKSILEDIKRLNISTYRYKSNAADFRSFGLIAQNVAEYFPEVVSETQDKDGQKLLCIAYGKTGVLAIKAIQEQQIIIEQQQINIEQLQQKVEMLERKLSALVK